MDCRTARHLLDYTRPQSRELDVTDVRALHSHLAVCADCDHLARAERRLDDHLARAVNDVPVPQGLKQRLLERLTQERNTGRRWVRYAVRFGAAAAVLLLAIGLYAFWKDRNLPSLDPHDLIAQVLQPRTSPPSRSEVEEYFKQKGFPVKTPAQFDNRWLAAYGLHKFGDQEVPYVSFIRVHRVNDRYQIEAFAEVFILSGKQFDLKKLPGRFSSESGDQLRAEVWHSGGHAYVIRYTGDLNKLLNAE